MKEQTFSGIISHTPYLYSEEGQHTTKFMLLQLKSYLFAAADIFCGKVLATVNDRIVRKVAYRDKLFVLKKELMADLLTGKVQVPKGVQL